ncbi:unnamed protein product [Ceutorhynchus assimilis]|uniref:RNA helicase n=1 Tax=Ceutorhynchus assimilis TaxID=467358 RepID=A0A9N9MH39_9CUCU|nr:unnamed protein product [Ceutorhynchus assimilis]
MSSRAFSRKTIKSLFTIQQKIWYSSALPKCKGKQESGSLLISCKRKEYDHYSGTYYDKLEEIPLASKGWTNNKARHDHFTVYPLPDNIEERHSFTEYGINRQIIDELKNYGIKNATEFQHRAIPTIQQGHHTLLAAETGCGKTISYLVPIIQKLVQTEQPKALNTPKVVVLVPNRELAYQIGDMAAKLGQPLGLSIKTIVGGRIKRNMENPTFEEVDIIVATTGALSKLSTVGIYKLGEVQSLVLDEADTLMDDSFQEKLEILIKRMSQAQLVLVSATLPKKVSDILVPYADNMQQVLSPRLHKPLLNITQKFFRITKSLKPTSLLKTVKTNKHPMLVFVNRNETCKWLAMYLRENGVPCANLSGDMNFAIRIEQWNQFVKGETNILAATDIGSRGLNTIQVRHVLNYDFPLYAADYIHRIGRVGRLGSHEDCLVTNFITNNEMEIKLLQQIELSIRKNQPLTNVDGNITKLLQQKIMRQTDDRARKQLLKGT